MKQGVKMLKVLIFSITIVCGMSCSMVKTIGVNSTASVMNEGSLEVNEEANFEMFEKAMPANLKVLETLWYTKQDNKDLLSLLIKGYGGLGFGLSETYYLDDKLKGIENSTHKEQALFHYTKAFDYGVRYFKEKGVSFKTLNDKEAPIKLAKVLDDNFSNDDLIAAFYFAQSWGSLINLQRDNVELVAKLGTVKAIMDWVCTRKPEFENGSCLLFYAVYEAGRPAMLGGDLEKGKKLFHRFINNYPQNLLARVAFIQYYIIPMMDEKLYAMQFEKLTKELKDWNGVRSLADRNEETKKYLEHKEFNLFNSIAEKRLEIIEKNKEEIF